MLHCNEKKLYFQRLKKYALRNKIACCNIKNAKNVIKFFYQNQPFHALRKNFSRISAANANLFHQRQHLYVLLENFSQIPAKKFSKKNVYYDVILFSEDTILCILMILVLSFV